MKKGLFIIFFIVFFFSSFAGAYTVHVRGYYRKNGTYVAPHTRSSPHSKSYGGYSGYYPSYYGFVPSASAASSDYSESNTSSSMPVATPQENISINNKWLDYYKSAAMINGDLSNIGKVEYICHYKEAEILWQTWENKLPHCHKKECFVNNIISPFWNSLNSQINNVYNYIKSAQGSNQ